MNAPTAQAGSLVSPFAFRHAAADDLERILEIHTQAYPDGRSQDERRTTRTHNPYGPLEKLLLAECDGQVVGTAFGFDIELPVGGVFLPVLGVASVAVAPEARGLGVATQLVEKLHANARAQGKALSLLYPFQERFYARMGYASVTPHLAYAVSPAALAFGNAPHQRPRILIAADVPKLAALRDRLAARALGNVRRSEALWLRMLADPRKYPVVFEYAGELIAYVVTHFEQEHPGGPTRMVVDDWAADGEYATHALFNYLAAQGAQASSVALHCPLDVALGARMMDADRALGRTALQGHVHGSLVAGPMVAVLDFPQALAQRGYRSSLQLRIVLNDRPLGFELRADEHGAVCTEISSYERPDLHLSTRELTQLFFGGHSAHGLVAAGCFALAPRVATELSQALGSAAFYCADPF